MILKQMPEKIATQLKAIFIKAHKKIWIPDVDISFDKINLSDKNSIQKILSLVVYGEYAAWQTTLNLSQKINDFEAKLALTSQAFDESRHFYMLKKYMEISDLEYKKPKKAALLPDLVMDSKDIAKQILGMHLMIEPVAMTLFKFIKNIDLNLENLIPYIERDEARHISIGLEYLPFLLNQMSYIDLIRLLVWQTKALFLELDGLKELENSFKTLGIDPKEVFSLAEKKQTEALDLLCAELHISSTFWEPIKNIIKIRKNILFG